MSENLKEEDRMLEEVENELKEEEEPELGLFYYLSIKLAFRRTRASCWD